MVEIGKQGKVYRAYAIKIWRWDLLYLFPIITYKERRCAGISYKTGVRTPDNMRYKYMVLQE